MNKDQTSKVLRYVRMRVSKVEVVESLIDFLKTRKSAEDYTNMILDKLEKKLAFRLPVAGAGPTTMLL